MRYVQVTVTTTSYGSDYISYLLEEYGSQGTSITDLNDVKSVLSSKESWDYVDESILSLSDERVFVRGFFDEGVDLNGLLEKIEKIDRSLLDFGPLEVHTDIIDSLDWENEWRKYYSPIKLGGVVVVPAWQKYDGKETQVLIEPGMAFGTGNHETTSMCISLLQDFDLRGKTVADVGCGSGILGVTALKLGAKTCYFNDVDAQAIKSTDENLRLNGISEGFELVCGDLVLTDKADVVVANITADILLRLCEKLRTLLRKGGVVIISGIIHARAEEVKSEYGKYFDIIKIVKKGEWQAMSLKKRV